MQKIRRAEKSGPVSRWWSRLASSALPTVGCEIAHTGISLARWSQNSTRLETAAWKPISAGALEASPLRENIQKPEEVRAAFAEALSSLGMSSTPDSSRRLTDAVLVIPDQSARLFVLNFDTFPQKASEGLPLVKWRLKKSVPFDIESAAISYFVHRSEAELQVVAAATPLWVIRQYETLAESFGLRPRRVTLSTLGALGLAKALEANSPLDAQTGEQGRQAGVLVAKYSPPWFTTAILQGGTLRLFRTVGLSTDADGLLSPAEVLSATYPSIAYFQDNFQGPLTRGYLCGLGQNSASISEALERDLNLRASPLVSDPGVLVAGIDPHQSERHFAALLGLLRE